MPVSQDVIRLALVFLQFVELLLRGDVVQQGRLRSRSQDLVNYESCFIMTFPVLQVLVVAEVLLVPDFLLSPGEPLGLLLFF